MQSISITLLLCFFGIFIVDGSPLDRQNATEITKAAVNTSTVATHSTDRAPITEQKPETKSVNGNLSVTAEKNETSSPFALTSKAVTQAANNTTIFVVTTGKETTVSEPITPISIVSGKTEKPATGPISPSSSKPSITIPTTQSPSPMPTTTERPTTSVVTEKAQARPDREFDGPSFIGGIVLAFGLTGIGFVAYKFCKGRTDRPYRNL